MTLGPEFEAALVAAQHDEAWGYEALWSQWAPAVVSYLRLQGALDPEDLASEVFLGAFRSLRSFTGDEGRFRGWLFTIAHRRVIDERRRARVRPQWADGAIPDVPGGDVEDDAFRRIAEERVRELCVSLPAPQRDVLLLRMVGDLTVEQVADALDRTPGAVKALQRRGLAGLRQVLEREGVPL